MDQTRFTWLGINEAYHDPISHALIEAMPQSLHFLYHLERGRPGPGATRALTGFELASRLSYFLWRTMPDEVLLEAARADRLDGPDGIAAEARRLIAHPRAEAAVRAFVIEWMGVDELPALTKDTKLFPQFDARRREAMLAEAAALGDHVIRGGGDGRLATLLQAPFSSVDPALADIHGIPLAGTGARRVELDPARRLGVLTQPGVLAARSKETQTSPVQRGAFVREAVLCEKLPSPPEDLNVVAPEPRADATTRERFEQHRADPSCRACHQLIDPVGLVFETFDAIGRHRASENGRPIDASGEIVGGGDAAGQLDGAPALARRLATSRQVWDCAVTQWFRFALGRREGPGDQCALGVLREAFARSNGDLRALLLALATSEVFRTVAAP